MGKSSYICTVLIKSNGGISIAQLPATDFPLELEIWTTNGPKKYSINLHYAEGTTAVKSATMTGTR